MDHDETRLTEEYVQDSFHSYLKSSLTHAKIERLLESEVLASAEGDLMITGTRQTELFLIDLHHHSRSCALSLFRSPALHHFPTISAASQKF